ncbi:hypothetical protein ACIHFC_21480 [Streptomyces sp. NPDC052013]|uniref:hypothetical protein n=1 Tax=Streptomyces sp. NPDC052013 TaxID=3365679 RepID=UPI0037D41117
MGERHSGRTAPGRRQADGRAGVFDEAALEERLAAALRRAAESEATEAEQRALAAFRTARDSGAHRARTRRRDDWRPRERRLPSHSVKALLGVLLAGLTLSGVAVAGIGTPGSATDAPDDRDRTGTSPTPSGPSAGRPSATGPAAPGASAPPDRPDAAQDTEAHCRAYEQVGGRGKALDATAWQRLTQAAGGEENVDAYCAGQERDEQKTADPTPADKGPTGNPGSEGSGQTGGDRSGGTGGDGGGSPGGEGSGETGARSGDRGAPGPPDGRTP